VLEGSLNASVVKHLPGSDLMSRTRNELMRPNNPNKRLRGRSRSKNSNPLARTYESNGPDVKIRGSAIQVAEKYAQLARDAHSAGDRVMAENYYQHAEHYYRIVAAAYEQQQPKDRRDDFNDRGGRFEAREDQPHINGYDGMEDDDGLRRTLRNVNGTERHDDDVDDDEDHAVQTRSYGAGANGNGSHHHANGASPEEGGEESGDAAPTAEAAPEEEEPKPRRRARASRARRPRKSEGNGEGQPATGETEPAEPTS